MAKTNPSGPGTYCGTLTDQQVWNVLTSEKARMERFPKGGETHEAARDLYTEAKTELVYRGLMHPSEWNRP